MTGENHGEAGRSSSLLQLFWRSFIGLVVIFGVGALIGVLLGHHIGVAARAIIETLGLIGVGICVFGSEAFGVPVPPSTYTFAAIAGESPVTAILIISFATSVAGASLAYLLGPHIGRLPIVRTWLERFRPDGEALFQRWGVWTVGVAALTPLPFTICCWLAGIYRMAYIPFFAATLVRAPRLLLYYGVFALGWTGAGMI